MLLWVAADWSGVERAVRPKCTFAKKRGLICGIEGLYVEGGENGVSYLIGNEGEERMKGLIQV